MRLTNFNVEAECTPSRSALLTGRYGIRTRQRENSPPRGVWYGITKWEITLAELLEKQGYVSGIFGNGIWETHRAASPLTKASMSGSDSAIIGSRLWPDSNSFQPDAHPDIRFAHVDVEPKRRGTKRARGF
ncbi:MAG: hypothetical protein CM15mP84_10930 [Cellvibrionales bacterium]|nr:MAG: hypothetical protein CM15mP84_10930 [Cellvibrionales bacterium]